VDPVGVVGDDGEAVEGADLDEAAEGAAEGGLAGDERFGVAAGGAGGGGGDDGPDGDGAAGGEGG